MTKEEKQKLIQFLAVHAGFEKSRMVAPRLKDFTVRDWEHVDWLRQKSRHEARRRIEVLLRAY